MFSLIPQSTPLEQWYQRSHGSWKDYRWRKAALSTMYILVAEGKNKYHSFVMLMSCLDNPVAQNTLTDWDYASDGLEAASSRLLLRFFAHPMPIYDDVQATKTIHAIWKDRSSSYGGIHGWCTATCTGYMYSSWHKWKPIKPMNQLSLIDVKHILYISH